MKFSRLILLSLLIVSGWLADRVEAREDGSVMMFAGQSREEFANYLFRVCVNGAECPVPAGAAFYTSLDAQGFDSPHANAQGDNHQDMWFLTQVADGLSVQIGLWLGADQLAAIGAGQTRTKIDLLASKLGALKRPIYLRVGYEFDGPHNNYQPELFIKAYIEIAKRMRQESNVHLVWHSYAMLPTFQGQDILAWYPGDEYVDWIGLSFFQVTDEGFHTGPNRERVLEVARQKNKPVMIGEASAIRYTARQKTLRGQAYWDYWYKPFFDLIESHDEIKAASIINVNWDSQRQHAILSWGDSQIDSDPIVLMNWRAKMREKYWDFSRD
ncbi:glycosyl hydrolase [Arenicella xantha]|uniref:Glycosyl hydrolase family 26 n=1 Tax=Arenicella xantha TaxID=644221 RepID=A0A395JKB6_9GAMM|nr:glycosyl hydrolase [Arenicella xantha]RBP51182.1 glycosyl hydrolase family 26 [Arenicella xantha]